MNRFYTVDAGKLRCTETEIPASGLVWADLEAPSSGDLARLSGRFGVQLPSREEQEEIEQSSRLYLDHGHPVMTALVPARDSTGKLHIAPVSFVLLPDHLVTIRHHAPRPFSSYPERSDQLGYGNARPELVLSGLIEEIIDRLADITEQTGREIDGISQRVFGETALKTEDHRTGLRDIGKTDSDVMAMRESLMTIERLLSFLLTALENRKTPRDLRGVVKSQLRDVRTISEQAGFLQQKTVFLLDATLGLINIEQNGIIKIFSVMAVAFLPPTLVASAYGMNFAVMPELEWPLGYPFALGLMVISAVLPLFYFRKRGWL